MKYYSHIIFYFRFVKRLKEDSRESVKSFIDSSVDGDNFSSAKQTICSKIFKCILAVLRKLLTSKSSERQSNFAIEKREKVMTHIKLRMRRMI